MGRSVGGFPLFINVNIFINIHNHIAAIASRLLVTRIRAPFSFTSTSTSEDMPCPLKRTYRTSLTHLSMSPHCLHFSPLLSSILNTARRVFVQCTRTVQCTVLSSKRTFTVLYSNSSTVRLRLRRRAFDVCSTLINSSLNSPLRTRLVFRVESKSSRFDVDFHCPDCCEWLQSSANAAGRPYRAIALHSTVLYSTATAYSTLQCTVHVQNVESKFSSCFPN